jgi:hypothetical protein
MVIRANCGFSLGRLYPKYNTIEKRKSLQKRLRIAENETYLAGVLILTKITNFQVIYAFDDTYHTA